MSNYSITVINKSGSEEKVAIYQTYPNLAHGLPLVWILKNINDTNHETFKWETPWALNWGTSDQSLAPGVLYTSGGKPQTVEPNTLGGNNKMDISCVDGDFKSAPAYNHKDIHRGSMQVETDKSFTVLQSEKMSIAVYMNNKPTFAMQGRPNGIYQFDTHPTYWICTTDQKEGIAVSGEFFSNATKVEFKDGVTDFTFELNDVLQFKLVEKPSEE